MSHVIQDLNFRSNNKLICDTRRRPLCTVSAHLILIVNVVVVIVIVIVSAIAILASVVVIVAVATELPSENLPAELE